MTKINYLLLIAMLFFACLISCTEQNDLTNVDKSSSLKEEVDATLNLVKNFETTTKSSGEKIEILDYEKTTYNFSFDSDIQTKSGNEVESVDLYLIKFKKGDKNGFSIATGDERINRIYAYTDCGHITDTSFIAPLKEVIESIPYILEEDLKSF